MHVCQSLACVWDWVDRNAATIIALAALLLSVWGVLTTRLNARMSALPLLHTFQKTIPQPRFEKDVSVQWVGQLINGGLGPAIVTKYQLFVDGVLIDLANEEQTRIALAHAFGQDPENVTVTFFDLLQGAIAVPKDSFIPSFSLEFLVPTFADVNRIPKGFEHLALRVEYQSMYGDELLFESERAPLPPRLGLFRKHRR